MSAKPCGHVIQSSSQRFMDGLLKFSPIHLYETIFVKAWNWSGFQWKWGKKSMQEWLWISVKEFHSIALLTSSIAIKVYSS